MPIEAEPLYANHGKIHIETECSIDASTCLDNMQGNSNELQSSKVKKSLQPSLELQTLLSPSATSKGYIYIYIYIYIKRFW